MAEPESPKILEAAFECDYNSAYVWHNTVQDDRMVMQPCVWTEVTRFEPFWLGGYFWQNYRLTDRRSACYRYGLNENDYGAYGGATVWSADDEAESVWMELQHNWFTYPGVREGYGEYSPNSRQLAVQARFENPILDVYGLVMWVYRDFGAGERGFLYETGLNREIEVIRNLSAGADWNVNFGEGSALANLYGEGDAGVGGTTVKAYLVWQVTNWMSFGCTVAYTGVLNGRARQALGDRGAYGSAGWWGDGSGDLYPRDLLWGGLRLCIKY